MHRLLVLFIFLLFGLAGFASAADLKQPGKNDRCPVCGMLIYPDPHFVRSFPCVDGSQLFFDGAKDLFRYYFSLPNKQDSRTPEQVAGIYLTDYYSTRLLPVKQLYLVLGSDVYGPMGHELVPVAGKAAAESFLKDHQGTKIIRFEQLIPQLLPQD